MWVGIGKWFYKSFFGKEDVPRFKSCCTIIIVNTCVAWHYNVSFGAFSHRGFSVYQLVT